MQQGLQQRRRPHCTAATPGESNIHACSARFRVGQLRVAVLVILVYCYFRIDWRCQGGSHK